MQEKRDLFISYHTDSSKWLVEKLVPVLEGREISCWYAPRDCEDAWADVILEAIDKASMFLVIINEHSMNSEHVKNEINAAFSRYSKNQLSIIIFRVDTAKMNATTEYYLGRIHMVNGVEPPLSDRMDELINRIAYTKEHLEDKKALSENSKFKSAILTPSLCFIGRDQELAELDTALSTYKKVFVSGMGGVGKSELVRGYLVNHKSKFRSILYATYTTSLHDLLLNDNLVGITNFFRNPPDESDENYLQRKIEFIEKNGTFEDVLVVDNFDVKDDAYLECLMQLPISVVFTTRNTFEGYYNLKLDVIQNEDDLLKIFKKAYPKDLFGEDVAAVKQIFKLVGNHTLTVTLIANMMKKQRISPKAMVERLEGRVQCGVQNQQDVNNMIASLFEMSDVSDEEKHVLQNLLLVPTFGVAAETFFDFCKLESYEVLDELIAKHLVLHDSARDYVSLHPVLYRTVQKSLGYDDDACQNYMESVINLLNHAKYVEAQRRERVLETIQQIMKVLPKTSRYYIPFYLASSKTYHAFAKHRLTVEHIETLNQDGIPLDVRVEALTDVADAFRCMETPDKLLEKANVAWELCNHLDENATRTKQLKSELLGRFGWYHHLLKNHQESFRYFDAQLQLVLQTDGETPERIGWAYYNVGVAKNDGGEYMEAIEYFKKALHYFETIEMNFAIANAYDAISGCYDKLGEYDKALQGLHAALDLFQALLGDMHNDTARTKHLIAKVYKKMGDEERATRLHGEAMECIEKLGYTVLANRWREEFLA